jgi:hypothetical protein
MCYSLDWNENDSGCLSIRLSCVRQSPARSANQPRSYFPFGFRLKLIALQEQRKDSGETRGVM